MIHDGGNVNSYGKLEDTDVAMGTIRNRLLALSKAPPAKGGHPPGWLVGTSASQQTAPLANAGLQNTDTR